MKPRKESFSFLIGNPTGIVKDLAEIFFIIPNNTNEREVVSQRRNEYLELFKKKKTIEHISLSVSNACNFGCGHCMFFQRENKNMVANVYHRDSGNLIMGWETAKKCVDMYVCIMKDIGVRHGRVHFGNAEPLLNWPVIEKVLDYSQEIPGFTFEYAINTNLSLLTDSIVGVLKRYRVKIATSLDGLAKSNNAIRVTKIGGETFAEILRKIDLLETIGYPLDGISVTVTDKNFHLINTDIIDFACGKGMKSIAFDYDLINVMEISVTEKVNKIMELKSYARKSNIYFDGTWGVPFRRLMSKSLLQTPYSFCSAVEGRGLTFNPDGSIKACDYSISNIGSVSNVYQLFEESSLLFNIVKDRFTGSEPRCYNCEIEGFCGGQCHVAKEFNGSRSDKVFDDSCNFYKEVTKALIRENLLTQEGDLRYEEFQKT